MIERVKSVQPLRFTNSSIGDNEVKINLIFTKLNEIISTVNQLVDERNIGQKKLSDSFEKLEKSGVTKKLDRVV